MYTSIDYDNLLTNNLANVAGIFNSGAHIVFSTIFISDVDEVDQDYGEMDGGSHYVETHVVWSQYLIAVEEKDGDYIFYTCERKKSGPIQLGVVDKYYNIKIESLNDFISHDFECYDYPHVFFDNLSKSNVSALKEKVNLARMEADVAPMLPVDFPFKVSDPTFLHDTLKRDWRFFEEQLNRIIKIVSRFAPSQFAYVDDKGNNILMTYAANVDGWEKELVEIDIQTILDNMPYSTFDLNHDQKNALQLARENLEQLVKKRDSRHIVAYLETLFKV